MAARRIACPAALFALLIAAPATRAPADPPAGRPTITVIGARVEPMKMRPGELEPRGKPWDADHKAIPNFVYRHLAPVVGFPPLALFALIPYRNRPDPYVVVRAGEEELARSRPVQGAFAPTWILTFALPPHVGSGTDLVLEVFDDDLQDDDRIGEARAAVRVLLAAPGLHRLEGTQGLHDVTLLVRNPEAGEGEPVSFTLRTVDLEVRPRRPAGGDWDAGGNPLRRRFPRLRVPERLEGLEAVRPDLRVTARWDGGEPLTAPVVPDAFETRWDELAWRVEGRPGTGGGLLLEVVDADLLLSDPVGVAFVPLEAFVGARAEGRVVVEPDEWSGIARLEIAFD